MRGPKSTINSKRSRLCPAEALGGDLIPLSDPDITLDDIAAVEAVLRSSRLSSGPVMEAFEAAFAAYLGRKYAVAAPSGTMGLLLALAAYEIGPGDEVIASPHSFRETVHAIALAGAKPVFADIDYWSGVIATGKIEALITDKTRAIVASNTNGHPAQWAELRDNRQQASAHPARRLHRSHRLQIQGRACRHLRRRVGVRFLAARAAGLRRRRDGGHRRHRRRGGDAALSRA